MTRDELWKEIQDEARNLIAKINLINNFKDLDKVDFGYGERWHWYTSKKVNQETDSDKIHLHVSRDCGCCADAGYYVTPFITIDEINLYASPIKCNIGDGLLYGDGIEPNTYRFIKYEEYGYSDAIIKKIEDYLAENPPIQSEDGDDDDSDI